MEILKKDILKEMEEKSRENLNRGIDISVSVLKHEFPFITGWRYNDKGHYSRYTVYINLICDLEKTSEFYNSPIKKHYKNNGETDAPYPFFPLELSNEINENEKYELYTVMQKSFTEIYHEIPDEYRYLITDYISTDVVTPKEIYLEGFDFPSRKKIDENINEQFDIDYYETKYNPPKEESDEEVKNLTKNDLLEYGKRYFSKKFFRLFSPKKWRHAVNNRWLEDICNELHWDECGGDNKKIYGFFFEKDGQKYVYVGITNNITSRFRTHLDIKKTRLSKFQKAVEELEIDPKDIDFSVLFPFFLPPSNAAQIEINLIKYFIEDPNYICLNAATGGQLGSRGSSKYIIDNSAKLIKIQNIKDENEFMKLYPKEYNYLKKTRRLKYVNNLLDKRFFKQGQYTEKELEQIAKQYPSRGKLRLIDVNSYEAIRKRNLMDKFFPRDINESESSNDKVSLAKSLIQQLFYEVSFIEQSTYNDRPLLTVYFDSDDTAANIESVFTHEICDTVKDYTSGEIKCNPSWGPKMRTLRNNPDILIDAILLEYDDEGNILNENKLDEIERNLEVINLILNEISWDGLCEIWVEYNEDDKEYEIRSKSKLQDELSPLDEIQKELDFLDDSIRSMGIRPYIFTPWYVDDCEDEVHFLNESTEDTNYTEILQELVEPFKEDLGICDIKAIYDDEDDMYSVYLLFGMEELNDKYTSNGKYLYVITKVKEVKDTIKSYLPIQNLYVGSYEKPNCGWKPLNENWYKIPSSDYNSLEKIINLTMKEKYWWWKDIKINTLNYIDWNSQVQIEAELTVDEEWGANQWAEFYRISEFPGNKGWEDEYGYSRRVSLGDITDSTYAYVIRHDLEEIFKYTLNIESYNMSFINVYLIFE